MDRSRILPCIFVPNPSSDKVHLVAQGITVQRELKTEKGKKKMKKANCCRTKPSPSRPISLPHLLPPAPRPSHRRVTAAMAQCAPSAVGCHLPRGIRPRLASSSSPQPQDPSVSPHSPLSSLLLWPGRVHHRAASPPWPPATPRPAKAPGASPPSSWSS